MSLRLDVLFVGDDRVALRWRLQDIVFAPVSYALFRSGNAGTGFEPVAEGLAVESYLDGIELRSKFKPAFYRVVATIGAVVVESNTVAITARPNEDVLMLQRRERWKLGRSEGAPAMLYTRRRSGPLCPVCVTTREQGAWDNDCRTCYGTGLRRGYYPPLPIYVAQQSLDQEGSNITAERVIESSPANLWTSNWSIINPEDVIIEMTPPNHVWIVNGVQRTSRLRAGVRQLLNAKPADKGGALHHLPIPDFPFPDRSEVFFQDLQGQGRDFDTLFAERIRVYVENILPDAPDGPQAYQPPAPPVAGPRNPDSGFFA